MQTYYIIFSMNWKEHNLTSYSDYFQTEHWWELKYKYLTCNRDAQCFICRTTSKLLLHHVKYGALYKEKLNDDVYILCYDCHNKVHFWGFKLIKVPLSTNDLLFSMRLRRSIFCFRNRQFGLSLLWFLISTTIWSIYAVIGVVVWFIKITYIVVDTTLTNLLKSR